MTEKEQRAAAKQFAKDWAGRGDEKQDTQAFWLSLLQKVYGVEDPASFIQFERRVKIDNTSFIDGFIESTHVLIEQKGKEIDLAKGARQSDGAILTPYGQARRYAGYLPHNQNPRWIVVCNFQTFEVHDMNRPNDAPEVIHLSELEKDCHRLNFLVNIGEAHLQKEMEVSIAAGEIVGKIYDAFYGQYIDPNEESLKSLNKLCVRLVFCLYAEDAGIFGKKGMFRDYLEQFDARHSRKALVDLFRVLDTKPENRDKYLEPELAAFPYVNVGLFADEDIEIPHFNDEIRELLLNKASEDFNWAEISPTIFGAVFESTLNPETRRKGGMHYTSIENIHKVIDPLFLDELQNQLDETKEITVLKTKSARLRELQQKLAKLTFFDPACGSGNFLTETYLSLRRLENEIISVLNDGQMALDFVNPIQVSIGQFYGIELNDFAVTVAKTALWIAESQMLKETEAIMHMSIEFLPLKSYANIKEGNALRMPWDDVISRHKLDYIMGNPPFVGYGLQEEPQKQDILSVYVDENGNPYRAAGKIDYVAAWFFKAAEMMQNTKIRTAFVSTNSITQGEQVASVWKPLYDRFGIHIDFAHRTFRWDSEASIKAHVHCVIVGFSVAPNATQQRLFTSDRCKPVSQLNAYLVEAPDVFIESRSNPLCPVLKMTTGNRPADGGHLIIEKEDYEAFLKAEPEAAKYIKKLTGAVEYINNLPRYCLWLVGASPAELRKMPHVMKRIENCRQARLAGAPDRQRLADTPALFRETKNPKSYIIVPATSSENRRYIPLGFLDGDTIPTNAAVIIPDAKQYEFGILTSNVHMSWMRAVAGRLKSDYRYSKDIVYNNFPWPTATAEQKAKIEKTAQAILDARAQYPDSSLADLYDETVMPPELRTAHQRNDRAVMEAYGFWGMLNTEAECVAELMKMHQKLTQA